VIGPRVLHRSDRPSATALGVTVWRALEASRPAGERIVDDPYAAAFLPRSLQAALPGLLRARPLLDLPERNALTGLGAYVLCRHGFVDEHLLAALRDGVEQVVVLGAGYDSRAYRFADALAGRPVFEVDLPALSRRKARLVAARPEVFGPAAVRSVETDFRADSLAARLAAAGFRAGRPTFVAWEGVVPYLSRAAVEATLTDLRGLLGRGSTLALDLWDGGGSDALAPLRRFGAWTLSLVGEPVTFAVLPPVASQLLASYGLDVIDLAEAAELTARYATAGRVAAASLYLVAASR